MAVCKVLRLCGRALRLVDNALETLIFDVLMRPGRRGLTLGVAGLGAAAMLLFSSGRAAAPDSSNDELAGGRLLLDRPWLDHAPQNEKDEYQALIFNKKGFGVSLRATAYRGQWELFVYKQREGKKLEFLFPYDKRRASSGFSISKTRHGSFDLELSFDNPPTGPRTYYSWKDFKHGESLDEPLRSLALERWLLPAEETAKQLTWPGGEP